MLIMMSSSIPFGWTMDVSSRYNTVVVLINDCKFRDTIVYFFITLIVDPRSVMIHGMGFRLILTLTSGILRSRYLGFIDFPNIRSGCWPIMLTVGRSFFFHPCLFIQVSLMNWLYIGIYMIS